MQIQCHSSKQELIKSDQYVPTETSKAFGLLIEKLGTTESDVNTTSSQTIQLAFSKFQGLHTAREIKDIELCNVLEQLFKAIKSDIDSAYLKGKQDGANLLISLNNGDLNLNDFNEKLK